ncbi:hypothetical protein NW762_003003 [Fusarium torreyae]|uniref:RING-type domain-containing protein n=1 Tax=Fusarium torreyae TaxID=1237075 RepID=A0A9W8SAW2_9HYPO|nr:hypothetical protein NW762_003003 [Fusarium torreyae]
MDPITDTYWPVFKQEAEADVDKVRPIHLTCSICRELMTTSRSEPDHLKPKRPHAAWIMPCGHMFGWICITKWLKQANDPDVNYHKCPICKTMLHHHPVCGHKSIGQLIPDEVTKYSHIPPLLSAGGLVSPECSGCEAKRYMEQINDCTKIYEVPDPGLEEGQFVGTRMYIRDVEEIRGTRASIEPPQIKVHQHARDFEMPGPLLTFWNTIQESWAIKADQFWYDVDVREFEFVISVFQQA